ncbi:uncharacterized protein LOC118181819 [Stegodyphus dumicola]|uniref:uncharacterized protein LOC118181819 n=1 Tax=Stegodyphus dumicola TaxID=202533 RepID=UPI0015B14032|nr:uncharacterized protein LOC118181819 [Stegodyphus dumicola]
MGKMFDENPVSTSSNLITSLLIKNASIADLSNLNTLGIGDPIEIKSKEATHQLDMQQFQQTVRRDKEGRYFVKLPWLEKQEILKENKLVAERRCTTTEKLIKEGRYVDYDAVSQEWLAENIIKEVSPSEENKIPCHYLPHRGVFKKNSTTNVRSVFDNSCRSGHSPSLKDVLEKEPNLLEKILPLLLRFRERLIGIISGIIKALQISIPEENQDCLGFL